MTCLPGSRVTLRDLRADDVDNIVGLLGDPAVTYWLTTSTMTRDRAAAMLAGVTARQQEDPRREYYLAVCAAQGRFVGVGRLALSGVQAAELGYAICTDAQGHGYATDACETLIRFALHDLQLHRVFAAIGPDNDKSIAVVEKLGFKFEGRTRDHVIANGAWRDSLMYGLLGTDEAAQELLTSPVTTGEVCA